MQKKAIETLIEPVITTLGFEYVGCEFLRQEGDLLLRIYIDSEQGIDIESCTKVSRQISAIFDVEEPFLGNYFLEVSSPGLDRPLFTLAHYQKFIGQQLRFRTKLPNAEGRRRYKGILVGVEGKMLKIKLDESPDQLVEFSFDEIEKANIVADI